MRCSLFTFSVERSIIREEEKLVIGRRVRRLEADWAKNGSIMDTKGVNGFRYSLDILEIK